MVDTQHTTSYYAASANPAPARPALQGSSETDVCVIGAGFTGISAALHLAEQGFRVTVLEAVQVGFGASGRNGGQIVNSYSRDIDVIERTLGADQARLLGDMAFEGGRIIRELVARYNIDCDLKDGGVFAALNGKHMKHLESQKKLWERYGNTQLELLDERRILLRPGRTGEDRRRPLAGLRGQPPGLMATEAMDHEAAGLQRFARCKNERLPRGNGEISPG